MKKAVIRLLVVMVVVVLILWFGGRWILSFSTAQYSGKIELAGIEKPVEITFDARGIPQIWAENETDLFFALGWVHASERLFQMELVRRLACGELAEILGADYLKTDIQQRKIGFARKARTDLPQLDARSQAILQNYCAGINAWIDAKTILPPEFVLLGLRPRPWEPADCATIAIYQTWYAHTLMDRDFHYYQLVNKLGPQIKSLLLQPMPWSPATVPASSWQQALVSPFSPLRMTFASNSWVVAPEKSVSGKALHASDPHLVVNMVPEFWYLAGLHVSDGLNVLGVTTPGLPGVMMGHNGKIAFAFTVASVDLIDYYRLPRAVTDSLRVQTAAGTVEMTTHTEKIIVHGEETPRAVTIFNTPTGVVVEEDSSSVLTLKWAGMDFSVATLFQSIVQLQEADNWQTFQKAVTRMGALDVNWTYSDETGNIGYQLGAPIPRRDCKFPFMQMSGIDPQLLWQGYTPLEQTPQVLNPNQGWLASCNNQPLEGKALSAVPGFYDPYRIIRAQTWLTQQEKYSVADFEKMQMDQVSAIALRWKGLLADGATKAGHKDLAQKMNLWSGEMGTDSKEAGLFTFWWYYMSQALFEDELGNDWEGGYAIQEKVLSNGLESIIDDHTTPNIVEDPIAISARALEIALKRSANRTYGEMSQLTIVHPMSTVKLLDYWLGLNRGPIPRGGDDGALNANWRVYDDHEDKFISTVGPSMRYILDWADVDQFTILGNLGQSGNPFSPHYDDFFDMWQTGGRWQVPFSKDKVYARKQGLLVLAPVEYK